MNAPLWLLLIVVAWLFLTPRHNPQNDIASTPPPVPPETTQKLKHYRSGPDGDYVQLNMTSSGKLYVTFGTDTVNDTDQESK